MLTYIHRTLLNKTSWKLLLSAILGVVLAIAFHLIGPISSIANSSSGTAAIAPSLNSSLQQGRDLYQAGRLPEAIQVWQTAALTFANQGDQANQALALGYLALAHQELGQIQEANQAIATSLDAAQAINPVLAKVLNLQGQIQFDRGQAQAALETWQRAEQLYQQQVDRDGVFGTQLNRARALQVLGLYRRARELLETLNADLKQQPDSTLKQEGLLNLGNVLRVIGDLDASQASLEESLAIAERLTLATSIQRSQLYLGYTAYARQQPTLALKFYQQAASIPGPIQLEARLSQLQPLIDLQQIDTIRQLLPKLQTQLDQLPPNQTKIYAQIALAEALMNLERQQTALVKQDDRPQTSHRHQETSPWMAQSAQLLAAALQQARTLGNPRAESQGLGRLGQLYEQTHQWTEAKTLTQQALRLAATIQAADLAYQWQWQMGRLLKAENDRPGAIVAYTSAVDSLQTIRNDLVAINQDVQFSFREQVEPVYRELVALLLETADVNSAGATQPTTQKNLKQAREVIESLQLAELANFFREACLDAQIRPIDQLDPTAAVLYPIVLPNRLEVILSLPGQPLRHYAMPVTQTELEAAVDRFLQSMRPTSFTQERLPIAQQLYGWLIKPAQEDLIRYRIQTLVMVPDGALRNLPIAALHDGQQYLVEQYRLVANPGLQLTDPRPFTNPAPQTLMAGLSQGNGPFSPLPGVEAEVSQISATLPATVLLNQQFTTAALRDRLNQQPFSVMHLATHGQFSSKAEDTFILTWDGRINVKDLDTLLAYRDKPNLPPIELLVLSACQTAEGDKRAALGMAGIAVRSGARSTLASLWTVSDESTTAFMVEFYRNLAKPGITKAEAVRLAQLHLLTQLQFRHPYYWAPFILVGNWL